MVVDLYKQEVKRKVTRQIGQITTRKYRIAPNHADLHGLRGYFRSEGEFEAYRNKLLGTLAEGRHYTNIGDARNDSLFELEALNVSYNCKNFVMIADYSDTLDYILHRLYGCKIKDIRGMQDYHKISSAIINFEIDRISDIPFSRLFDASDELGSAFAKMAKESKQSSDNSSYFDDSDRSMQVAYRFYTEVLTHLSFVKFYVTSEVCASLAEGGLNRGIIRSTSYGKIVATVPKEFNETVTIHDITNNGRVDDYKVIYKTYKPYEYLGEVLTRDEFSRKDKS